MLARIVFPIVFSIIILTITYTGFSFAEQDFEFRGNGISLDSDLETPTLYKSSLRMKFNQLSEVTKGSLILRSETETIALRMVANEWNLSYNADGSFVGSGPVYTLQNEHYQVKIQGERKFVANNWSMWQAFGEIKGSDELYSFQLIVSGDDRFPNTPNLLQRIVIPTGNALEHERGSYIPEFPTIYRGTIVTWMNHDTVTHTVQSQDGKGNVISLFNSNVLNPGDSFSYQFDQPGVYPYLCTLHPWRTGTITVV